MDTLWDKINAAKDPLAKFRRDNSISACIYRGGFEGKADVVRWFYSRNNGCQVFFTCSKEVSDTIESEGWAEVSYEFTEWVEQVLMPFCVENTDWHKCNRYGIDYDEKIPPELLNDTDYHQHGCMGTSCACEPFGQGDFTYGNAEENEFTF